MKVEQILSIMTERGIRCEKQGKDLRLIGPRAAWTTALVRVLILHREKVLRQFGVDPAGAPFDRNAWPWYLADEVPESEIPKVAFPPTAAMELLHKSRST